MFDDGLEDSQRQSQSRAFLSLCRPIPSQRTTLSPGKREFKRERERESSRELIIVKAVSAKGSNRAEERRREEGDTDLELLLPCAALWKRGLWVLRVDGEDDGADHLLGALLEDLHVEFGVACVVRDLAARPSGSFPAAAAATRKERGERREKERKGCPLFLGEGPVLEHRVLLLVDAHL